MITKAELRHAMLGGPAKTWHEWRVSMFAAAVTFLVLAVGLRLVTGRAPWLWLAWVSLSSLSRPPG